jgi:hypothetical protein
MKKFSITLFMLIFALQLSAQVPQAFNYQAVARDNSGIPIANHAVGIKINIHQGSASGTVIYSENFVPAPTTNQFGLFTLSVGSGNPLNGTFSSINWGSGNYWLEVLMDATGGTTYTSMGTSQLLTVPFAMYAANSGTVGPVGPTGPTGPTGATGASGTTGQNVTEVYGTGQLVVSTATTTYTLIPGLTQTISVPANSKVVVSTTGGVQSTGATSTTYSVVDIGLFCDGVVSSTGGQRRIAIANTASLAQLMSNWSIHQTYNLSVGNHTFDVKAVNGSAGTAAANVSSGSAPQLQGVLTVMILKQ